LTQGFDFFKQIRITIVFFSSFKLKGQFRGWYGTFSLNQSNLKVMKLKAALTDYKSYMLRINLVVKEKKIFKLK